MKKLLTLIMAGCIALSLAACTQSKEPSSNSVNGSSGSTQNQDKPLSVKSQMGKVTSVAGNEVEINLVKEPELPSAPDSDIKVEGEISAAITLIPSVEAGTAGGGAAQRTEIELTGEMKSFVIPAGMPVKDAMGNEKQLSDIKKGLLLNVMVDEEGNIAEVFLYE